MWFRKPRAASRRRLQAAVDANTSDDDGLRALAAPLRGREFDFLLVDEAGHCAVFSTAGYGPIPLDVVARWEREDARQATLRQLPVICDAYLEGERVGNWQEWSDLAQRGLFTFDWKVWEGPYLRISRPASPIDSALIGGDVEALSLPCRFQDVTSIDLTRLRVEVIPAATSGW